MGSLKDDQQQSHQDIQQKLKQIDYQDILQNENNIFDVNSYNSPLQSGINHQCNHSQHNLQNCHTCIKFKTKNDFKNSYSWDLTKNIQKMVNISPNNYTNFYKNFFIEQQKTNYFKKHYLNESQYQNFSFLQFIKKYTRQFYQNDIQIMRNPVQFNIKIIQQSLCHHLIVFEVLLYHFKIKIQLYHLPMNQTYFDQWIDNNCLLVGSGSSGKVYSLYNNTVSLKRVSISEAQLQNFNFMQRRIMEFVITKLCSCLEIGPRILKPFKFDIICTKNSFCFFMQNCTKISENSVSYHKDSISLNYLTNYQKIQVDLKNQLYLMHTIQIIHYDIKPENIMYSPSYKKVVFIDFGLAQCKNFGRNFTEPQIFKGTYFYCSQKMKELIYEGKQKFIDVYYNDAYCLQKSLKVIKQNIKMSSYLLARQLQQLQGFNIVFNKNSYLSQNHKINDQIESKNVQIFCSMDYNSRNNQIIKQGTDQIFQFNLNKNDDKENIKNQIKNLKKTKFDNDQHVNVNFNSKDNYQIQHQCHPYVSNVMVSPQIDKFKLNLIIITYYLFKNKYQQIQSIFLINKSILLRQISKIFSILIQLWNQTSLKEKFINLLFFSQQMTIILDEISCQQILQQISLKKQSRKISKDINNQKDQSFSEKSHRENKNKYQIFIQTLKDINNDVIWNRWISNYKQNNMIFSNKIIKRFQFINTKKILKQIPQQGYLRTLQNAKECNAKWIHFNQQLQNHTLIFDYASFLSQNLRENRQNFDQDCIINLEEDIGARIRKYIHSITKFQGGFIKIFQQILLQQKINTRHLCIQSVKLIKQYYKKIQISQSIKNFKQIDYIINQIYKPLKHICFQFKQWDIHRQLQRLQYQKHQEYMFWKGQLKIQLLQNFKNKKKKDWNHKFSPFQLNRLTYYISLSVYYFNYFFNQSIGEMVDKILSKKTIQLIILIKKYKDLFNKLIQQDIRLNITLQSIKQLQQDFYRSRQFMKDGQSIIDIKDIVLTKEQHKKDQLKLFQYLCQIFILYVLQIPCNYQFLLQKIDKLKLSINKKNQKYKQLIFGFQNLQNLAIQALDQITYYILYQKGNLKQCLNFLQNTVEKPYYKESKNPKNIHIYLANLYNQLQLDKKLQAFKFSFFNSRKKKKYLRMKKFMKMDLLHHMNDNLDYMNVNINDVQKDPMKKVLFEQISQVQISLKLIKIPNKDKISQKEGLIINLNLNVDEMKDIELFEEKEKICNYDMLLINLSKLLKDIKYIHLNVHICLALRSILLKVTDFVMQRLNFLLLLTTKPRQIYLNDSMSENVVLDNKIWFTIKRVQINAIQIKMLLRLLIDIQISYMHLLNQYCSYSHLTSQAQIKRQLTSIQLDTFQNQTNFIEKQQLLTNISINSAKQFIKQLFIKTILKTTNIIKQIKLQIYSQNSHQNHLDSFQNSNNIDELYLYNLQIALNFYFFLQTGILQYNYNIHKLAIYEKTQTYQIISDQKINQRTQNFIRPTEQHEEKYKIFLQRHLSPQRYPNIYLENKYNLDQASNFIKIDFNKLGLTIINLLVHQVVRLLQNIPLLQKIFSEGLFLKFLMTSREKSVLRQKTIDQKQHYEYYYEYQKQQIKRMCQNEQNRLQTQTNLFLVIKVIKYYIQQINIYYLLIKKQQIGLGNLIIKILTKHKRYQQLILFLNQISKQLEILKDEQLINRFYALYICQIFHHIRNQYQIKGVHSQSLIEQNNKLNVQINKYNAKMLCDYNQPLISILKIVELIVQVNKINNTTKNINKKQLSFSNSNSNQLFIQMTHPQLSFSLENINFTQDQNNNNSQIIIKSLKKQLVKKQPLQFDFQETTSYILNSKLFFLEKNMNLFIFLLFYHLIDTYKAINFHKEYIYATAQLPQILSKIYKLWKYLVLSDFKQMSKYSLKLILSQGYYHRFLIILQELYKIQRNENKKIMLSKRHFNKFRHYKSFHQFWNEQIKIFTKYHLRIQNKMEKMFYNCF